MSLRLSGGRRLVSPAGGKARPTAARVRLAVMNLLAAELPGCRWLDLCCGSGVMACEALRRGASQVEGVEGDRRIAAVARTNLRTVAAGEANPEALWHVHHDDVLRWLARPCGLRFDLIYVDPPWNGHLYGPIAAAVEAGGWLREGGTMVWECASGAVESGTVPVPPPWRLRLMRRYGGSTLLLLSPAAPCASAPEPSSAEGAAPAVLVPGGHEQPHQGDGDQTQHDAAEKGFDHWG